MFNNFSRQKRNLFYDKNKNFWQSRKSLFAKGVNPCFQSRNANFFICLFSLKIRLETRFNNVLGRKKKLFFDYKNKILQSPQKWHFSKRVNPCFWLKKCQIFLYLGLVKVTLEKMLNNFWREKRKKFSQSQKSHFSKRVNHAFGQKMPIFSLFVFA